jgi:hypothetical protein
MIGFTTPTHERPELHASLYRTFASQTVEPKRLYVLDTSEQASPFFSSLQDSRVVYVHAPGAFPREDGVTRIGAARNYLNSLVEEPFIQHLDDDDWIDPDFSREMLKRLGDAALVKLDVWRLATDTEPHLILEWDTRQYGGTHFALEGGKLARSEASEEMPPEVVEMWREGYGFSMIYPRATWERHPFPDTGTEDFPFVQAVRAAGERVVFVSDLAHMVLHLVSPRSRSAVFPQKIVGVLGLPRRDPILEYAARRMGLGATELPTEKAIEVRPGMTYSVLASLSRKHTLKALATQAAKWGLTIHEARDEVAAEEFDVNAPPPDYRLVHLTASASKAMQIPWKVPAPMSAFDKTRVIRAWSN